MSSVVHHTINTSFIKFIKYLCRFKIMEIYRRRGSNLDRCDTPLYIRVALSTALCFLLTYISIPLACCYSTRQSVKPSRVMFVVVTQSICLWSPFYYQYWKSRIHVWMVDFTTITSKQTPCFIADKKCRMFFFLF